MRGKPTVKEPVVTLRKPLLREAVGTVNVCQQQEFFKTADRYR